MPDFAVYWSWYRSESAIDGDPIVGWRTNRAYFADQLRKGGRLWLFVGGDACGDRENPHKGYLAEVFVVEGVEDTPDDDMKFRVVGDEDQCELVSPPRLIDSILRKPGSNAEMHIG